MNVQMREMSIQDYDQVYALWRETEGIQVTDADSRQVISRFLERNPGLSFVARDGELLVGAVLCGHDGRFGYIDQLAVRSSHRRQGVGKSLVGCCLYNLMREGIHKYHLFVVGENQIAIEFWRKIGWAQRVELVTMTQSGRASR